MQKEKKKKQGGKKGQDCVGATWGGCFLALMGERWKSIHMIIVYTLP